MIPLFVRKPRSLAWRSRSRERANRAPGRTVRYRRGTVSTLWFRMSGRDASTMSRATGSPLKSGTSNSTAHPGTRDRMAATTAAKTEAPPSGWSSRLTEVMTAWRSLIRWTASATRRGSSRSGAAPEAPS